MELILYVFQLLYSRRLGMLKNLKPLAGIGVVDMDVVEGSNCEVVAVSGVAKRLTLTNRISHIGSSQAAVGYSIYLEGVPKTDG